jgi:hypothetical protein
MPSKISVYPAAPSVAPAPSTEVAYIKPVTDLDPVANYAPPAVRTVYVCGIRIAAVVSPSRFPRHVRTY